ncbi:hypothetical protein PRCB_13275 [Pantoea rodasii]|uniref:ClpX-type ZB domain-containing protein n=1 Tax=Pantoea rodasii TaxID=1076549 RepID=A0A2M9WBZ0_9GAMM|nr:hypothetical protein PRCB_13275 [Pantoea rodasii]
MKTCKRCGKKMSFFQRMISTDEEVCEECLFIILAEIRSARLWGNIDEVPSYDKNDKNDKK